MRARTARSHVGGFGGATKQHLPLLALHIRRVLRPLERFRRGVKRVSQPLLRAHRWPDDSGRLGLGDPHLERGGREGGFEFAQAVVVLELWGARLKPVCQLVLCERETLAIKRRVDLQSR